MTRKIRDMNIIGIYCRYLSSYTSCKIHNCCSFSIHKDSESFRLSLVEYADGEAYSRESNRLRQEVKAGVDKVSIPFFGKPSLV